MENIFLDFFLKYRNKKEAASGAFALRCCRACAWEQGKGMLHAAAAVHVMGKGTRVMILVT